MISRFGSDSLRCALDLGLGAAAATLAMLVVTGAPSAVPPTLEDPIELLAPRSVGVHHQFVISYVGLSTCPACQNPKAKEAVRGLQALVKDVAIQEGATYSSLGVALDWDLRKGLSLLEDIGGWSELIIGNNWYGEGAWSQIWSRDAVGVTPQVVIYSRRFSIDSGVSLKRLDEVIVARYSGLGPLTAAAASPEEVRAALINSLSL